MPHVPGLRSPYSKVGRLVYFGRLLDKIRLHAAGKLPAEYHDNLGEPRPPLFDARCCRFLGIPYATLSARVLAGGTDDELLAWAEQSGTAHTDDDCNVWNRFMTKIGWRDDRSELLRQRIAEFGLTGKPIETFFDLLDFDERRDPVLARAWELRPPFVALVMGVAGSGKTTLGHQLASELSWAFYDADDFHPPENVAKMAAGTPLTDDDRLPWLEALRARIDDSLRTGESAVATCSALKESYRSIVMPATDRVKLIYLRGSRELLHQRLATRVGHFMKPSMLDSQLDALEEPRDALILDIAQSPQALVATIRQALNR